MDASPLRERVPLGAVMPGSLRVIPLGGLGEIGLNMLLLEVDGAAIAIDCGVLFPERPGLGIDLLLPDLTYLKERPGLLRGVVLTHGHEDHIGALPSLLSAEPVPVFGPRLAITMVGEKLRRHGLTGRLEVLTPGTSFALGPFEIEPIHITHSIADAFALAIETPAGTVVHTGDFKLDPRPVDGRVADVGRLEEWGKKGVKLLLSDSTNVEHDGECGSESDVGPALQQVLRKIPGRALVTTFASHLHRVQQVVDASEACGRRVAVAGRGFEDSTRLGQDLGYLTPPRGGFLPLEDVMRKPAGDVTVLVSGSQGELNSALSRLSEGRFKNLMIDQGDGVVMSSRVIPGNERSVHGLLNRFAKRGVEVHRGERVGVHVSGHAYRDELREVIRLVQPEYFVPVHGEYRHLAAHRRLAEEMGLPGDHCVLIEDGDVLELDEKGVRVGEQVPSGRVLVDSGGEGSIGLDVLRERRLLSQDGFVVAVLAVHPRTGEVTSAELVTRGVLRENEGPEALDDARSAVVSELRTFTQESLADQLEVEDAVRRTLKRYFSKTRNSRPLIVPHIFEV